MKDLRQNNSPSTNLKSHPDFDFVKPGHENLFMVGLGGRSGTVFTDIKDYGHYSSFAGLHNYILCHEEETIERIKSLQKTLKETAHFRSTARLLSCNRTDIIRVYDEHYPERNVTIT